MVTDSFEITYAAHTASCTFLLDAEGICRRIVMAPNGKRQNASRNAARCVGAQYVASLDPSVPGCLVEMPRVGVAMLFARVDERGRVALVRTGVVTRFEAKREKNHDPFEDTGQVSTSAPKLPPTPPTPRMQRTNRETALPDDPYDGEDLGDRTQPIQALRHEDLANVLSKAERAERSDQSRPPPRESGFDITSEYESDPGKRRSTLPSQMSPSLLPTLRTPPVPVAPDDSDPYAANARSVLPKHRSEPPPPPPPPSRMKSERVPSPRALEQPGHRDTPRVQTQWTGNKAVVRRRGDR